MVLAWLAVVSFGRLLQGILRVRWRRRMASAQTPSGYGEEPGTGAGFGTVTRCA